MTIRPIFAWYDLWIGAYWDATKRRLYIFPVPMFGLLIQFSGPRDEFLSEGGYSGNQPQWNVTKD